MEKVKRIFIKISRVCFAIFFGMLMIFVVFAMINEPEEVSVPTILGLGFVLSVIALVVCDNDCSYVDCVYHDRLY